MQPMWCYAGNPIDLDGANWRITPADTDAKDSLNPEALQLQAPSHRHVTVKLAQA